MESTGMKTMAVVGIIIACFATFLPRLIGPLFMRSSNVNKNQGGFHEQMRPSNPPALSSLEHHQQKLGILPGMHAATEMRKYMQGRNTNTPPPSSNILSFLLPLYATAIVVYLIYTLMKLFSKSNKSTRRQRGGDRHADRQMYTDVNESTMMKNEVIRKQKQLEKLLLKAENDSIDDGEMCLLRQRLTETEKQMTKILTALDHIQLNFNNLPSEQPTALDPSNNHHPDLNDEEEDDEYDEEEEEEDEYDDDDDDVVDDKRENLRLNHECVNKKDMMRGGVFGGGDNEDDCAYVCYDEDDVRVEDKDNNEKIQQKVNLKDTKWDRKEENKVETYETFDESRNFVNDDGDEEDEENDDEEDTNDDDNDDGGCDESNGGCDDDNSGCDDDGGCEDDGLDHDNEKTNEMKNERQECHLRKRKKLF